MFFRKKKSKAQQEIDQLINDIKLNLENNYKDLAIKARKDADAAIENSYSNGTISKTQYEEYKMIVHQYSEKMKNYNHQQFYHSQP